MISRAADDIAGDVIRTPMSHSRTLSAIVGTEVHVKFENLQFTGSFKDRGAANHLRRLTTAERDRGIIALSAGNHAQGVAYHAGRLGLKATIVMPATAPFTKVVNTEALGAEVVQHGQSFSEAREKLEQLQADHGYSYVHPFDDLAVIAGQGTVALEMLGDEPGLDVLLVPIGGGGLIAGMAVAAKALRPSIQVIGVQIEAYATVAAALEGRAPPAEEVDTLADGIAVKTLGTLTFPIIEALVDEVLIVSEDATERAISLYLEIEKTVAEGAGAVALAALVEHAGRFAGQKVGLVLSGGNIDVRMLASVLMRGLVRTKRISALRVKVRDLPGQLAPIVSAIAAAGANVVEIDHRRLFDPVSARSTNVDIVIETRDGAHRQAVVSAIEQIGHRVEVLS
jgi:threonine dehydratase